MDITPGVLKTSKAESCSLQVCKFLIRNPIRDHFLQRGANQTGWEGGGAATLHRTAHILFNVETEKKLFQKSFRLPRNQLPKTSLP